ncbi:MAG: hypothetical protein EFT35_06700 [Methanophagales archaeon ANME-1-THS]|nr:MAG: hypothetical protein EFT35_06700 [Methanophagales archaeon ANME-1-THS]
MIRKALGLLRSKVRRSVQKDMLFPDEVEESVWLKKVKEEARKRGEEVLWANHDIAIVKTKRGIEHRYYGN